MGIKINMSAVNKNFQKYLDTVDKNTEVALDAAADSIKRAEIDILRENVKNWTGNLANSIIVTKGTHKRNIGPLTGQAPYAAYIEQGDGNGDFEGYQFVKRAVIRRQPEVEYILQRVILGKDIK